MKKLQVKRAALEKANRRSKLERFQPGCSQKALGLKAALETVLPDDFDITREWCRHWAEQEILQELAGL